MTKKLLLELPLLPEEPVQWLLWENAGEVASGTLPPEKLGFLAERYAGVPCYALINGQAVSHHRIVLPKGGRVGLAALPFQLEERLCTDLDQVHIAHVPIKANQPCDVLVIDRQVMARCHQWLSDSGLAVTTLLPDYAVLPTNVMVLDAQRGSVHLPGGGAGMDCENFPVWWQIAAEDVPAETGAGLALRLFTPTDWQPEFALPDAPSSHFAHRLQAYAQVLSPWSLNLLSGEFALQDQRKSPWTALRWPAILLLALVAVHWAELGVRIATANSRAEALEQAMNNLYQQTFPGARVVNARAQMRSQLAALEGGAGEQSMLLPWLENVAAASKDRPISVKQIAYENRPAVLKIQLAVANFEQLDQWVAALAARGFSIERGAFNQDADLIVGQVVLRSEGAQ